MIEPTEPYWYLAGPMTNYESFNFPAFDFAAAVLREKGENIVSPAEMDPPEVRAEKLASPDGLGEPSEEYHWYMARDAQYVLNPLCKGVVVLPGWEYSTGARMECFIAHTLKKPILTYNYGDPLLFGDFAVTMGGVTR